MDPLCSLLQRHTERLLIPLVRATCKLEDLLVGSDAHGFQSDDDRDQILERVMFEIQSFVLRHHIRLDDSIVRGSVISPNPGDIHSRSNLCSDRIVLRIRHDQDTILA